MRRRWYFIIASSLFLFKKWIFSSISKAMRRLWLVACTPGRDPYKIRIGIALHRCVKKPGSLHSLDPSTGKQSILAKDAIEKSIIPKEVVEFSLLMCPSTLFISDSPSLPGYLSTSPRRARSCREYTSCLYYHQQLCFTWLQEAEAFRNFTSQFLNIKQNG